MWNSILYDLKQRRRIFAFGTVPICLSLISIGRMLSLVLVEKPILNSLHLPSFSWKLSFEVFLTNTPTALCIELSWFFATKTQIVLSSTYFHDVCDMKMVQSNEGYDSRYYIHDMIHVS